MKIYFDACCINRPFDDQSQGRIRLESEAVLMALSRITQDQWQWLGSPALTAEIKQISDTIKKQRLLLLLQSVNETISINNETVLRTKELELLGFQSFDALHLACAEQGQADVFLTTDDKLLNRANRLGEQIKVQVKNPLQWIQEV
jgi:predicted nucleic acid-binding protein